MPHFAANLISRSAPCAEKFFDFGVMNLAGLAIAQQILLADIGPVAAVRTFGEQMVKRLIFCRSNRFRYRLIPFLAVGKNRVYIEDNPAKFKYSVANDIAN